MKRTIIIVDDFDILRNVLQKSLREVIPTKDAEIIKTDSKRHVLKLIEERKGKVDLVSSNIGLRDFNGLKMMGIITKKYPKIKTIIASANGHDDNLEIISKVLKIDVFFHKPFDFSEYSSTVEKLIFSKETTSETRIVLHYYGAFKDRPQKKKIVIPDCIECASKDVVIIAYGTINKFTQDEIKEEGGLWGGCVIYPDSPKYLCKKCKFKFGNAWPDSDEHGKEIG